MNLKRIITMAAAAVVLILGSCSLPTGRQTADLGDGGRAGTSNQTGTNNGYFYSFWSDGGGTVNYTNGSGGNFSVNWSNCGNFVGGKGWNPGGARTITWSGSSSGAQYVGVYGWMQNPLVEYYIPRSGGTNRGTYSADGTTYTLYTNTRTNQPSIEGTKTFQQYFCSGGGNRSVNFQQHLDGWRKLGMGVGSQNYQIVAVEGWGGSSGSANITVGSGGSTPSPTPTPPSGTITLNAWQCNNHSSGLNIWTGGVGSWTNGAWIEFNSVNLSGKTRINFNLATTQSGQFAIKVDSTGGTQIGTLGYGSTGGWNNYQNKSTSLNNASGTHNLYIICTGGAANVGTITVQ